MNPVLDLMARASAVLVAALLVWIALRRYSASARSAWLRSVLVCLVGLPLLVFLGPSFSVVLPWLVQPEPIFVEPSLARAASAMPAATAPRFDSGVLLWLLVSAVALLPMALGASTLHRRWRAGREVPADRMVELRDAGIKANVQVRMSPVSSPFVFGVLRPRLMLPKGFFAWPEHHRHAALLHEGAHLMSGDSRWLAFASFVRALYVAHPLAWWLSHALRSDTELAADERAIAQGVEPTDYAASLVEITRNLQTVQQPRLHQGLAFVQPSGLEVRVRGALGPRRRACALPGLLGLSALAGTLVFAAGSLNLKSPDPDIVLLPSAVAASFDEPHELPVDLLEAVLPDWEHDLALDPSTRHKSVQTRKVLRDVKTPKGAQASSTRGNFRVVVTVPGSAISSSQATKSVKATVQSPVDSVDILEPSAPSTAKYSFVARGVPAEHQMILETTLKEASSKMRQEHIEVQRVLNLARAEAMRAREVALPMERQAADRKASASTMKAQDRVTWTLNLDREEFDHKEFDMAAMKQLQEHLGKLTATVPSRAPKAMEVYKLAGVPKQGFKIEVKALAPALPSPKNEPQNRR